MPKKLMEAHPVRNLYGDKSRREEHQKTMFKTDPREEAGPQYLRILQLPGRGECTSPALVTTSPWAVSRPASSVTPATHNITNASTLAPAVSSTETVLLGLSLGTTAPSLLPA